MKNYLASIYYASGFLLVYLIGIQVNLNTGIILFMFFLSPLVIFYMVYTVLKADFRPTHTFEEKWYEDQDK